MAARIPVIVNAKSGPDGTQHDADAIVAAFRAHGLQADVSMLASGSEIVDAVDSLINAGATLVVAGGGDGTINAVAARLLGGDVALGVLPLGTLNHFARDLGLPLELDDAVGVVADGYCVAVDAGEVNGQVFLNNSSMGLYPRIVSERDQAQKRLGLGKWPALVRATWHALLDPASFNAVLEIDGNDLQRLTPFIFVGNNGYVLEGFGIGTRNCLDAGVLSLHVLRPKNTLGLLWLGLRALLGIGSHVKDFEAFEATDFRVEGQRNRIEVARDGEVAMMETPVHYRIRPRTLAVLASRDCSVAAERRR